MPECGRRPSPVCAQDKTLCEIPLAVVPIAINELTWKDGIAKCEGKDPFLVFALPKRRFVHAIRVEYSYGDLTALRRTIQLFWRDSGRNDFEGTERTATLNLWPHPTRKVLTIPIQDGIDQFRIDPDIKPCVFQVHKLALLVKGGPEIRSDALDQLCRTDPCQFEGSLDLVSSEEVLGWAWEKGQGERPVEVNIYKGEMLLATVQADTFREDLLKAGKGNGKHGFRYVIPIGLKDNEPHTIRVTVSATSFELVGSPATTVFRGAPLALAVAGD